MFSTIRQGRAKPLTEFYPACVPVCLPSHIANPTFHRMESSNSQNRARLRAPRACNRCNSKRVKCDGSEVGLPCSRCRQNGESECGFVPSKRGRYLRTRLGSKAATVGVTEDHLSTSRNAPYLVHSVASCEASENSGEVVDSSWQRHSEPPDNIQSYGRIASSSPGKHSHAAGHRSSNETFTRHATLSDDVPSAEQYEDGCSCHHNMSSTTESSNEVSWVAMFDRFLEHQGHDTGGSIDKYSITYLGETFPVALLLQDLREGRTPRLHYPGSQFRDTNLPYSRDSSRTHPSHVLPEELAYLTAKRAFAYPASDLLANLLGILFERVLPLYPVVDREDFMLQYKSKTIPWILLHACCFASLTFCNGQTVYYAGFASRMQARHHFYSKAKSLFDTGYESNKIIVLQSAILLSFWGGSPNSYSNFYTWIST